MIRDTKISGSSPNFVLTRNSAFFRISKLKKGIFNWSFKIFISSQQESEKSFAELIREYENHLSLICN